MGSGATAQRLGSSIRLLMRQLAPMLSPLPFRPFDSTGTGGYAAGQLQFEWTPAQFLLMAWILLLVALASPQVYGQAAIATPPDDASPSSAAQDAQRTPTQQNSAGHSTQPQGPSSAPQQQNDGKGTTAAQSASIVGTATDVNDDPIPGATVVVQGPASGDQPTVSTNENGFFEIHDLTPGIPYRVTISAAGFVSWTSQAIILKPGQFDILIGSKLQIEGVQTSITVSPETTNQIATQQVKIEETQRGFGIIPNFFTVYNPNPAPLTARLKFKLAFRVATDPFTAAGSALIAGANHAAATPSFSADGLGSFGERMGASYGNSLTDIMFSGAILPSLLHQDPRYYSQGTGTKKSRTLHALSSIVMAKGDNGRWQPNYSSLGGDLASAAIANTYYPASNRGAGLVFQTFAIDTAVHASVRLLQEFVFRPRR